MRTDDATTLMLYLTIILVYLDARNPQFNLYSFFSTHKEIFGWREVPQT